MVEEVEKGAKYMVEDTEIPTVNNHSPPTTVLHPLKISASRHCMNSYRRRRHWTMIPIIVGKTR